MEYGSQVGELLTCIKIKLSWLDFDIVYTLEVGHINTTQCCAIDLLFQSELQA